MNRSANKALAVMAMGAWTALLAPRPAAAGCPPTVGLSGPAKLVRGLTVALVERGVRVEPGELPNGDCERLTVNLREEGGAVKVTILDPWGRSSERTVKELLTSASLIESWARLDLLDGVNTSTVSAPATPAVPPTPAAPAAPAAPATPAALSTPPSPEAAELQVPLVPVATTPAEASTTAVEAPATEPTKSLTLRVLGEGAIGRDRSRWAGASAAACAHLGFVCLGLEGRYARGDRAQNAVEALLLLEARLTLGFITFTPGVGVGAGWIGTGEGSPVEVERDNDRFDPRPAPIQGFGARAEARLGASIDFTDSFGLELGASASASPELRRGMHGLLSPEQAVLRAQAGLVWRFE